MNRKNSFAPAAFAILLILQSLLSLAVTPQKVSYQSVIRNASGELVKSGTVGMRISILQGTSTGTAVYVETHSVVTNINGLATIEVGMGAHVTNSFSDIDWGDSTYFLKAEADPAGGESYTITGISEILSVPYALYAKTAGNGLVNGTAPGQMQYWNGSAWVTVASGITGQVLALNNGVPTWVTIGAVIAASTDVYNTKTGKIWMDRNLGASQVATSSTDAASYGDLYQWGRGTDGHEKRTSGTTSTLSGSDTPGHGNFITISSGNYDWRSPQNANLWQGVSGTNNPCPSGYRLPTDAEWEAELTSWGSNNSDGAFVSPLKLPVAGLRYSSNGSLINVGSSGYYWSSTIDGVGSRSLSFYSSTAATDYYYRAYGFSVRCLKD